MNNPGKREGPRKGEKKLSEIWPPLSEDGDLPIEGQ
jgi:hypothetical protein